MFYQFLFRFCDLNFLLVLFYYLRGCSLNIALVDLQNEKNAQNLFEGIEKFDHQQLKHAVTQEKNPLPGQEGELIGVLCC